MSENDHNVKLVKSAVRVLDILELLSSRPDGLGLTEIGEQLDIPLSSAYGLVATLMHKGYAVRDETSLVYRLGSKLSRLSVSFTESASIVMLADAAMLELRNRTGETISLTVLDNDMITFLHKRAADGVVQVINPVGTRLPAHATGSGKIMLAYLSEDDIDHIYPEERLVTLTPRTINNKSELKRALREARERGYSYDDEESANGVWAVAGCVRDRTGYPVASLSIVAPSFRVKMKDHSEWHKLISEAAEKVSSLLHR